MNFENSFSIEEVISIEEQKECESVEEFKSSRFLYERLEIICQAIWMNTIKRK